MSDYPYDRTVARMGVRILSTAFAHLPPDTVVEYQGSPFLLLGFQTQRAVVASFQCLPGDGSAEDALVRCFEKCAASSVLRATLDASGLSATAVALLSWFLKHGDDSPAARELRGVALRIFTSFAQASKTWVTSEAPAAQSLAEALGTATEKFADSSNALVSAFRIAKHLLGRAELFETIAESGVLRALTRTLSADPVALWPLAVSLIGPSLHARAEVGLDPVVSLFEACLDLLPATSLRARFEARTPQKGGEVAEALSSPHSSEEDASMSDLELKLSPIKALSTTPYSVDTRDERGYVCAQPDGARMSEPQFENFKGAIVRFASLAVEIEELFYPERWEEISSSANFASAMGLALMCAPDNAAVLFYAIRVFMDQTTLPFRAAFVSAALLRALARMVGAPNPHLRARATRLFCESCAHCPPTCDYAPPQRARALLAALECGLPADLTAQALRVLAGSLGAMNPEDEHIDSRRVAACLVAARGLVHAEPEIPTAIVSVLLAMVLSQADYLPCVAPALLATLADFFTTMLHDAASARDFLSIAEAVSRAAQRSRRAKVALKRSRLKSLVASAVHLHAGTLLGERAAHCLEQF